jgi:hypothetical protein
MTAEISSAAAVDAAVATVEAAVATVEAAVATVGSVVTAGAVVTAGSVVTAGAMVPEQPLGERSQGEQSHSERSQGEQPHSERPYGASPDERGSLGTLSWQRAAKIAGLAGAVAALIATSVAAGQMARVSGPANRAHTASVVSPQRAPALTP